MLAENETAQWSVRDVNEIVESRGRGGGVWHLKGSVIALATGRVLANINGVEEVRISQPLRRQPKAHGKNGKEVMETEVKTKTLPLSPDATAGELKTAPHITHSAELLVRNSLFFTTEAGALMREFRLRPTTVARKVGPVLSQATRVSIRRRSDGTVSMMRASQAGGSVVETDMQRGASGIPTADPRDMLCASWRFIGRRVSSGGSTSLPGVVERCDYVVGRRQGVWHWSGVGRCPSWYGRGQCVTYLEGRKVPTWRLLDDRVRAFLAEAGRPPLATDSSTSDRPDSNTILARGTGPSTGLSAGAPDGSKQVALRDSKSARGSASGRQRRKKIFGFF